jgi:hypothetical protein
VVSHPGPPQIRACPIKAHGSSGQEFARGLAATALSCYPPSSCSDGSRARCPWHLSLRRSPGPAPPSLHGVPRVGSPASTVLFDAPNPLRPSRRASFPSHGGIPVASVFRSHGRRMRRPRAWSWSPGTSRRDIAEKVKGPPRFLENPRERALFFDPGGIAGARPLRRRDAAFRCVNDVGSREDVDFGAQWHGPLTRCLRFAARVTPAPRKTRSRSLAKLCRTGLVTRRVPMKGFCTTMHPPFPSFPGALTLPTRRKLCGDRRNSN